MYGAGKCRCRPCTDASTLAVRLHRAKAREEQAKWQSFMDEWKVSLVD